MLFLYSLLYTLGVVLMLPRFIFGGILGRKGASGFFQRLGSLPQLKDDGRKVVWLHCVSVGETNAARSLVDQLLAVHPEIRLVISTTTKTGQTLARSIFADKAELVFYVPFDWKFSVRRALKRLRPSLLLVMETEIWFNLIRETGKSGAAVAIVNGRLSERSKKRYGYVRSLMRRVLNYVDLALMQGNADAQRLKSLGMRASKVKVTGNLKFDHDLKSEESILTEQFRSRFAVTPEEPLILVSSSHSPEEKWILEAFRTIWNSSASGASLPRLMIAPRHPERFDEVADQIAASGFEWVRRTATPSDADATAEVILLDSIGELRSAYPLAEVVFVAGSMIEHGGQSIFEPAAAGRAIVTGPYTHNFDAAVKEFLSKDAIVQIEKVGRDDHAALIAEAVGSLLTDAKRRHKLGENAAAVMAANRGAARRTVEYLEPYLRGERG